jgi:hypothetical protein
MGIILEVWNSILIPQQALPFGSFSRHRFPCFKANSLGFQAMVDASVYGRTKY